MLGVYTGKMASQVYQSHLLTPRPDFLGAGRGLGDINIHLELSLISGLSITSLNFHNTSDLNEDLEMILAYHQLKTILVQ